MWATNEVMIKVRFVKVEQIIKQGGIDRESQWVSQRPKAAAVLGRSDQIPKGRALQVRGGSTSRE